MDVIPAFTLLWSGLGAAPQVTLLVALIDHRLPLIRYRGPVPLMTW